MSSLVQPFISNVHFENNGYVSTQSPLPQKNFAFTKEGIQDSLDLKKFEEIKKTAAISLGILVSPNPINVVSNNKKPNNVLAFLPFQKIENRLDDNSCFKLLNQAEINKELIYLVQNPTKSYLVIHQKFSDNFSNISAVGIADFINDFLKKDFLLVKDSKYYLNNLSLFNLENIKIKSVPDEIYSQVIDSLKSDIFNKKISTPNKKLTTSHTVTKLKKDKTPTPKNKTPIRKEKTVVAFGRTTHIALTYPKA
jgi:hypothetical protein